MEFNRAEMFEKFDMIMDQFDFEKVHKVMELLNWTWGSKDIPNYVQLETMCYNLFEDLISYNARSCVGSGGFEVEIFKDDSIELRFVLTSSRWYPSSEGELAFVV
jgi:hypothetical protein